MASEFLIVTQDAAVPVTPTALRKAERHLKDAVLGRRSVVILPPGLKVEAACCGVPESTGLVCDGFKCLPQEGAPS